MPEKINSACQLNDKIIEMVNQDERFRVKLLNDPRVTIEKAFNLKIPENIRVAVLVNTKDTINIEIPPKHRPELTDEELESVAGGFGSGDAGSTCVLYGIFPNFGSWQS